MKKTTILSVLIAALNVVGVCQAAKPLTVARVNDIVTLQLSNGEMVSLIGVEPQGSLKKDRKEAEEFVRRITKGKQVRLEYDVQQKDKFGRTLAYVYLSGPATTRFDDNNLVIEKKYSEMFLNGALIGAGYARAVATPPNVKHQDLFLKAQKEAQEQKRGLWK